MEYSELIARALKGRSINKAAQVWGVHQRSLDRYAKGERMPDYKTALIIAQEAEVDPGEVMRICAREETAKKPMTRLGQMGLALGMMMVVSVNLFLTPQTAKASALPYEKTTAPTQESIQAVCIM